MIYHIIIIVQLIQNSTMFSKCLDSQLVDLLSSIILADLGVFYFVCIIQHGPHEFYCSRVLSTNDVTEGNFLVFPDKFTL